MKHTIRIKKETSREFMARKSSCLPNIAGNRAKYPSLPAVSSQKTLVSRP